ncbi:MAG: dCMP deaminase family protein [Sulfurimonas sp.]|jgi:dCMP deaminase
MTEIPTPDKRETFMRAVYLHASSSKDPRTKIGAVLVKDDNIISTGFNGFPRKVKDYEDRYNDKEIKYSFIVHGEQNAVLTAARLGINTYGSTLYSNGIPCCSCMKAIIQAGCCKVVVHKQWPNLTYSPKWVEATRISEIMMNEAGIELEWFDKILNINGFLDGKEIAV